MPFTAYLPSPTQTSQKKRPRDLDTNDITHKSARLIAAKQPENIVQFFKLMMDPDNRLSTEEIPLCVHAQQWLDQHMLSASKAKSTDSPLGPIDLYEQNPHSCINHDSITLLNEELPELDLVNRVQDALLDDPFNS